MCNKFIHVVGQTSLLLCSNFNYVCNLYLKYDSKNMYKKICQKKNYEFVSVSRAVTVEILHGTKRGLHGLKGSMTVTDSFCTIENSK